MYIQNDLKLFGEKFFDPTYLFRFVFQAGSDAYVHSESNHQTEYFSQQTARKDEVCKEPLECWSRTKGSQYRITLLLDKC